MWRNCALPDLVNLPYGFSAGDGFLASLSVQSPSGEELLAGFDPMEAEYRLVVPFETKFVTIDAMAAHQRAVVFGLGKAELGEPGSVHCDPGAGDGRRTAVNYYTAYPCSGSWRKGIRRKRAGWGARGAAATSLVGGISAGDPIAFPSQRGGEEQAVGLFAMEDLAPKLFCGYWNGVRGIACGRPCLEYSIPG